MRATLKTILLLLATSASLAGYAQTGSMVVRDFEYVKSPDDNENSPTPATTRHFVNTDSLRLYFSQQLVASMEKKWNVKLDLKDFYVRGLPIMAIEPKFKTEIKDRDKEKWYLFMQVFDRGRYFYSNSSEAMSFGAFRIRCKVLNGANDSVIFSRDLHMIAQTTIFGDTLVSAGKLVLYPADFKRMADSIIQWTLMDGQEQMDKSLVLRPACLFLEKPYSAVARKVLDVTRENWGIIVDAGHAIPIKRLQSQTTKGRIHRNVGGNIASGTLTVLTGIGSEKTRSVSYEQHFPFSVDTQQHHVYIRFREMESGSTGRERSGDGFSLTGSGYQVSGRSPETGEVNELLEDTTVVAKFSLAFIPEPDTGMVKLRVWDGRDTASIMELPEKLREPDQHTNFELRGEFDGRPFVMRSYGMGRYKMVFLEDRIAIMMKGFGSPERIWTYQDIPDRTLKLFTILAMVPYGEYR